MSAHTPTPWAWDGNRLGPVTPDPDRSPVSSILDAEGGYGFLGSDVKATLRELDADRAFIVLAVNAHDDLVAALHDALTSEDGPARNDRIRAALAKVDA